MAPSPDRATLLGQLVVERDARDPGRFRTEVDPGWHCPEVPHGGVMAAIAARALAEVVDAPDQRLRSVHVVFADRVESGPVEVDAQALRRGRSLSQAIATTTNPGRTAGHTTTAVFGADRPLFDFTELAMPEVPPPEECPSYRERPPDVPEPPVHFPFWERVEGRAVDGHPPWDEWEPGAGTIHRWYRFDDPPVLPDGTLDPGALITLCDTMPGAVAERLGSGQPPWVPPSCDLTVHLLGPCRSPWVLVRNRAHHAGGGYASAEIELWDPEQATLVAWATQMMLTRLLPG